MPVRFFGQFLITKRNLIHFLPTKRFFKLYSNNDPAVQNTDH